MDVSGLSKDFSGIFGISSKNLGGPAGFIGHLGDNLGSFRIFRGVLEDSMEISYRIVW